MRLESKAMSHLKYVAMLSFDNPILLISLDTSAFVQYTMISKTFLSGMRKKFLAIVKRNMINIYIKLGTYHSKEFFK